MVPILCKYIENILKRTPWGIYYERKVWKEMYGLSASFIRLKIWKIASES